MARHLSRSRDPRAWTIRAALGLLAVIGVVVLGGATRHANATNEGDITYTVVQSPAAGAIVQVGEMVSFAIDVTSAPGAFGPVVFDLKKPASMSYASYGSQSGNIVTGCADNTPASGYVRCTTHGGFPVPAGALQNSGTEAVINFVVDASAAGTAYSTGTIQGLFTDSGTGFRSAGDQPDGAGNGDDLLPSVGSLSVTNIIGAGANISVSTAAGPSALVEGAVSTVTVVFNHALGTLSPTPLPIEVAVTNADIQAGSVSCPGGTGTGGVFGAAARCTGSIVGDGGTMSFQLRALDTAAGDDIAITVSAPSLGLTTAEAAASAPGVARLTIGVDEVGLQTVTLPSPGGAAPPWLVGSPITVCTLAVGSDIANDAAAGIVQDPSTAWGTSTLSAVTPLAAGDFAVTGPVGAVSFTHAGSGAGQCGANQSGLTFTPPTNGSYTVSAFYNGDTTSAGTQQATRGSNVLALSVQATNPVPVMGSLSPSSTNAGGGSFSLTVNGSNFVAGSTIRWNGADRVTTFNSANQLVATVAAGDIAASGSASVTVYSPAPGGGVSGPATFTINGAPNPAPLVSSLTPSSANAGSPGFTITVNGSNFVNGAVVRWNGSDRVTNFLGSTQLTANVLAADIASAGTANVSVFNPAPGGGTSPAVQFTITTAPNPVPSLSSISPSSGVTGGPAFTLTVNGSNFVAGSVVRWNGTDRPTTYVSAGQLTAAIPAGDLAATGTAAVTVFSPAPGGGTTASLPFSISNPGTSITTLSPASATAGGAAFTLTVNGNGFLANSVVRWGGADRPTTYGGPNQLTASITAADIATAGSVAVTVYNPAPGGGESSPVSLPINNAVPAITALSPGTVPAGSAAFTLTVDGTGFVSGSTVRWDGADRPTTYVSPTRLTVAIPASDLLTTRSVSITVSTPAPGGGVSAAQTFNVGTPVLQSSAQLVVKASAWALVARSRLTFTATTGDLDATVVAFIIKRTRDNKYWNNATHTWQENAVENAGTASADDWTLSITADDRRLFVATEVVVEARAIAGGLPYKSAETRNFTVR